VRDDVVLGRLAKAAYALLVVAAAYSGAVAVNAAIAFFLDHGVSVAKPRPSDGKEPTTSKRPSKSIVDYSIIFERNLFGSEPIAVTEGSVAAPVAAELDLRLRGTAEFDGRGFAVIEETGQGRQEVFAVGERVFDGPRLVGVRDGKAILLHKGRKTTLEIAEDEENEGVRHGGGHGKKADVKSQPEASGIRQTSPYSYLVDRREVEHSIENLNTVITQMRAVPYLRDGKSLGFRVFNIRPNSLFERMGLENGDVIQNVNGNELSSPTQALGLLDSVQSADEIVVNLLRNDEPHTMTYTIR